MTVPQVIEIGRDLLYTAVLLALPALLASLLLGLIISVFQTITSIQEQTLTFVPRILAVGVLAIVLMPWALQIAIHFTVRMLWQAAEMGR